MSAPRLLKYPRTTSPCEGVTLSTVAIRAPFVLLANARRWLTKSAGLSQLVPVEHYLLPRDVTVSCPMGRTLKQYTPSRFACTASIP